MHARRELLRDAFLLIERSIASAYLRSIERLFQPSSPFTTPGVPFPRNFRDNVRTIVRRLFRIYAHIYSNHFDHICALGIERTSSNLLTWAGQYAHHLECSFYDSGPHFIVLAFITHCSQSRSLVNHNRQSHTTWPRFPVLLLAGLERLRSNIDLLLPFTRFGRAYCDLPRSWACIGRAL